MFKLYNGNSNNAIEAVAGRRPEIAKAVYTLVPRSSCRQHAPST
jgi:hypothetical protein